LVNTMRNQIHRCIQSLLFALFIVASGIGLSYLSRSPHGRAFLHLTTVLGCVAALSYAASLALEGLWKFSGKIASAMAALRHAAAPASDEQTKDNGGPPASIHPATATESETTQ
jgi:hypothetical protein